MTESEDCRLDPEFRRRSGFVGDAPLWRSADGWVLVDRHAYPRQTDGEKVSVDVGRGNGATAHLDHAQAADMAVAVLRAVAVAVREEWSVRTHRTESGYTTYRGVLPENAADVHLRGSRMEMVVDGEPVTHAKVRREVLTLPGGHELVTAWEVING